MSGLPRNRRAISKPAVIRLPAAQSPESFLDAYWQKQHLFMPDGVDGPTPSLTRNELGWLATLDDVESRIVFTDRSAEATRYRAESGPFDIEFLQKLPNRDWTLLVHDVEKHLPELRSLFDAVPFIPDWRIDDLMVSFAAPGGGVGPHKDNYDVFLVQGIGARNWTVTSNNVLADAEASSDLSLLSEFDGERHSCTSGDVLYLPPGVAHWGTATRACMTYSIGMRAPRLSDLVDELPDEESVNPFYCDPDLAISEVSPGYLSPRARQRADELAGFGLAPESLGCCVTLTKDWLMPERVSSEDCDIVVAHLRRGGSIPVHGMSRIAWDDSNIYLNGEHHEIAPESKSFVSKLCKTRVVSGVLEETANEADLLRWLLQHGGFDLTAIS